MSTTQATPKERTARELLRQHRPLFLGVDGAGAAHYWDSYEFAVAIVADDNSAKVELANTPFETLAEWCQYTRSERGWDVGPNVGNSLVDQLAEAVR